MEEIAKTQFFYKREITIPPVEEDKEKGIEAEDGYTKTVLDSFDIERIIRTVVMDDGKRLVLLDDLHERYENRPKTHPKTGAPRFDKKGHMMFERVKDVFQSEIVLSEAEGDELMEIIALNKHE
jgi:hypothetical protein